ncbi:MAG: N-acetylmuramoyl-L-alanine amidase [candidate division Zixibacteria bacterium]|nr:N-acetylmuramoyl-L-alanine amidase [candidate division Zixibacteria bacterium]MDH4033573.1 N-acetylmuramoyl-L-alanine amidase [candidate division Zixibacteria bacterium]
MFRRYLRVICLLMLPALSADSYAAETVEVVFAGGKQDISAYHQDRITYLSFSELAEILGGTLDWETVGHQITYTDGANRFDFVLGSPFFKLNDHTYNMTFEARLKDGRLYLPAETFVSFLNGAVPQSLSFDSKLRLLRMDSEYFNVTDLEVSRKANGLLVELMLTGALAYEVYVTEGNWLNISITEGRINQPKLASRKDSRYMYKLTTHQAAGSGQVSMRLKVRTDKLHHKMAYNPPRIQISIADAGFVIDSSAAPIVGPDDKVDVIVIDAGHGGSDYGAIGPGKTREKDVVLNIARELAKLIRKEKLFKVVMTRDGDRTVTLDKRADIANSAGADLFISIHANASVKKRARGWNVFFLAPAKNDSARSVAQFENSFFLKERSALDAHRDEEETESDQYGLDNPILSILNEMIMTEFQAESYDLALMLGREFRNSLNIPSRGVDQAGFFVLNKVFTPSVLIETGFISNKKEEKTLKSKKYHRQVAQAVYKAIKKFKVKYEQKSKDKAG